nr:AarF/UbiB family protein [Kitasatospora fiedleri]
MPERRTRGWLLIGRACATTAIIAGHLIAALPLLATRRGRARMADRTPRLLTALGPFFVKAGQLVSTRRDLLPERWCDALAELADEVRPPRRAAVARTLAGAGLTDAFAEFDWEPVACGSIASVHRARLADGTEVAVKVQRHGIRPVLEADLRLALLGARAGRVLPGMRDLPAEEMIGQLGGAVLHQLDFTAERDALLLLRANLGGHTDLRIPAPVEGLCAPGVLTMEFVPGLGRFRPLGMTPNAAGKWSATCSGPSTGCSSSTAWSTATCTPATSAWTARAGWSSWTPGSWCNCPTRSGAPSRASSSTWRRATAPGAPTSCWRAPPGCPPTSTARASGPR